MTAASETFTFTGTASETDGFLNITGGSAADTIVAAGAADTIDGGAGADSITGGAGADSITGGDGADTFVYTAVSQSSTSTTDTLVDFTTGSDKLEVTLDYSSLLSAATVNATLVTAAAGVTAVQNSLSAERGQYIYDTTNNALYVNVNNDNLITTLDYKINSSTTNSSGVAFADGDINFTITTGSGIDTITAGGGADSITAGSGADSITAGGGDDTIIGGTGADTIAGGTGANTFVVNAVDQTTTLTAYTNDSTNVSGADVITGIDGGTPRLLLQCMLQPVVVLPLQASPHPLQPLGTLFLILRSIHLLLQITRSRSFVAPSMGLSSLPVLPVQILITWLLLTRTSPTTRVLQKSITLSSFSTTSVLLLPSEPSASLLVHSALHSPDLPSYLLQPPFGAVFYCLNFISFSIFSLSIIFPAAYTQISFLNLFSAHCRIYQ